MVLANGRMRDWAGRTFFFKNDGQNPSASFKDRGMASAFSYLDYLIKTQNLSQVLTVCASTGDTSAAALYASYLVDGVTSAVLLLLVRPPQGLPCPVPGTTMDSQSFRSFVTATPDAVAELLGLRR